MGWAARDASAVPALRFRFAVATGTNESSLGLAFVRPRKTKCGSVRAAPRGHALDRPGLRCPRRALRSRHDAALLSYSYYAHSAFSHAAPSVARILFQLHPHPESVRSILRQELERWPDCAVSLGKEWELSLPEEDFARLAAETRMADCWIAASTFTKRTLVENGADPSAVHVIPYGVDLDRFRPRAEAGRRPDGVLRLLFVGTIGQRKGIRYLLEALRLLPGQPIELLSAGARSTIWPSSAAWNRRYGYAPRSATPNCSRLTRRLTCLSFPR